MFSNPCGKILEKLWVNVNFNTHNKVFPCGKLIYILKFCKDTWCLSYQSSDKQTPWYFQKNPKISFVFFSGFLWMIRKESTNIMYYNYNCNWQSYGLCQFCNLVFICMARTFRGLFCIRQDINLFYSKYALLFQTKVRELFEENLQDVTREYSREYIMHYRHDIKGRVRIKKQKEKGKICKCLRFEALQARMLF